MNRKQRRQAAKKAKQMMKPADDEIKNILANAIQHHQTGRLAAAETLYHKIIQIHPKHPEALHLLGVLAHQQGQNTHAAGFLEKAIAVDGTQPLYHYHLGEVRRACGQLEAAVASYRQSLTLHPGIADVHYNLGNALFDLGRFNEAVEAFHQALALAPHDAEIHNNLGNTLAEQKEWGQAIQHYRQSLAIRPDYPDAWLNLASVLEGDGQPDEAETCYRKALTLSPTFKEIYSRLGRLLKAREKYHEALVIYRQLAELEPHSAWSLYQLGHILEDLARQDEAMATYRRAIQRQPDFAEAYAALGTCLQSLGRFQEAMEYHEKALALAPHLAEIHYQLLSNRNFEASDIQLDRLTTLLENPDLELETRIKLHFSLANSYDRRHRPDEAFQHYRTANTLKARFTPFDPSAYENFINRLIALFDADFFKQRKNFGLDSELPIFIVGMPRSGTTLVEQILSSHPQLFGAGELDALRIMVRQLPETLNTSLPFPECTASLNRETVQHLAQGYLQHFRDYTGHAIRISDKLPSNFFRLGLIALLFPHARIIHCQRDPLDTCVSCYFQNFAHGQSFTYDLTHLGIAYRGYQRLLTHWRQVIPLTMLDVSYEDLVLNQASVSRRLIEFCGLDWDDRCLAFHQHDRPVRTASFWQVRQPLYHSSIGRWRAYEKHLTPLLQTLQNPAPY